MVSSGGSYIDVSGRSLLTLEGIDGLDLLQRISTNDISNLRVGEHVQTILTNEKGRIVDVIVAFRTSPTSLTLSGRSNGDAQLESWIDKYIVMEDAHVSSLERRKQVLLFDLTKIDIIPSAQRTNILTAQLNHRGVYQSLLIFDDSSGEVEAYMQRYKIEPSSAERYEKYRIRNAIPEYPNEISESFNPLEIELGYLVSLSKGCYVGQEVIARLDTYQKVNRRLKKLELTFEPDRLPQDLYNEEKLRVGVLTSSAQDVDSENRKIGLGIINVAQSSADSDLFVLQGEHKFERISSMKQKDNSH